MVASVVVSPSARFSEMILNVSNSKSGLSSPWSALSVARASVGGLVVVALVLALLYGAEDPVASPASSPSSSPWS